MKTLDRYIVRQYLINFAILFAVFVLLFVVVDVIFNLDEVLEAGEIKDASGGEMWSLGRLLWSVAGFYGPLVALLYVFFSGLLVVAAMGFTFAGLARSGELIGFVTSGISMYRIAASVLVAGFVLTALTLPDQELIIPRFRDKLTRGSREIKLETAKAFGINYAVDDKGSLLSAAQFDVAKNRLTTVAVLIRDKRGLTRERITADAAVWDGNSGWILEKGAVIRPDIADPQGGGSLASYESTAYFRTTLSPAVLMARHESFYPRLLGLPDLMRLSNNPVVDTGSIRQIMHSRFSLLVLNMLILVMGLPFFLLREPANMILQGAKAAALCLGAWGAGLVLMQVGAGNLSPVVSAWLPVVIYLPVAAFMLGLVKT
jgi:lipopolysaccharide export system permease protein